MSAQDDEVVWIDGRSYPSRYPPGCHWATDEAWSILNSVPEDAMSQTVRCFLAGLIAGTLMKYASPSAPNAPPTPRDPAA